MVRALMIGAPYSGSGKTTLVAGLLHALVQQGYQVQSFKVGPDYIDPSYHSLITGRPCRNLDLFLMNEEAVKASFFHNSRGADFSIIEGVMGLFDGMSYSDFGSTAHIARILSIPVLLVWPCRGLAHTIIPLLKGLSSYDPELNIAGIILNQVNSEQHFQQMKELIEAETRIKVIGSIGKKREFQLNERHLGLVPAVENQDYLARTAKVGEYLRKHLDWETLFSVFGKCNEEVLKFPEAGIDFSDLIIAYAFDEAFNFYYQDALDLLTKWGVKLVKTSPLHDEHLPENIDGLIIGGGFPELFIELLKENRNYIASLIAHHQAGMPIYAECGGYMYLAMVNIIPASVVMQERLVALGYYQGITLNDSIIGPVNTLVKGHQFHYSELIPLDKQYPWAASLHKPNRHSTAVLDGYAQNNIFASYLHIHWGGQPDIAYNFLSSCLNWQRRRVK
ncbi:MULTISPECIES: cobyrinate a,c-diamide synthase [unclassified Carboxydocella]|uniref:cobyrinate a,c-diamide synthase n=1 Tax=unclassified Carboxydocella TaxID=2685367 RepID=UPI0009ADDACC|nr:MULTISPECIES: cobyrinate a,c-diamide synthase [unclassified Carboxydocella]GAW27912.1 cobyrinic acid a,c-diamide synthase [Carboxydocella sp. ULO1]GAW31517.1 cobyrinic acid a,c-diamide synthase [Carboxydocella sp. JDF658]